MNATTGKTSTRKVIEKPRFPLTVLIDPEAVRQFPEEVKSVGS